ncbi:4-hydroxy-tetrahydrodipicolinate synthase [Dyadobacter sp. CECT 9275]|uniref:4-hydroxy-tetrahydrodipicolinate synthase n=2 Tax=Dyadobacter helix TaxID=2822344 RepID=A0A916JD00_9BACT|nr:4-hydroxy-tetrahydrodipicolinate synthase [Dyadobacter sp. CECT 9275]
MLLPVRADNGIDYQLLEDELDILCSAGISGIYSNGTAGEFFNQTESEFDSINQLLAQKCSQSGIPFQIGASHMSPLISLERIRRSRSLKPGAFQVIMPDWVAPNPDEQVNFLKVIAEEAFPIPLVLYHVGHTKTVLKPADFGRLALEIPSLIGIKVGAGGAEWYTAMLKENPPLSVFVPGHKLATGVKEGVASGAYSNMACIHPQAAQQWYLLMQEDLPAALEMEQRITQFFDQCILPLHFKGYSDMALDKFLAAIGGWTAVGTRVRWPYQSIDQQEVSAVRKIGRKLIPEFFLV